MPRVGFEPTIPVFKQVETFHALGRAVTKIGALTPLAVFFSCKLAFLFVGLKISYVPTVTLKSPNKFPLCY
jgi:hypothetical protein